MSLWIFMHGKIQHLPSAIRVGSLGKRMGRQAGLETWVSASAEAASAEPAAAVSCPASASTCLFLASTFCLR